MKPLASIKRECIHGIMKVAQPTANRLSNTNYNVYVTPLQRLEV